MLACRCVLIGSTEKSKSVSLSFVKSGTALLIGGGMPWLALARVSEFPVVWDRGSHFALAPPGLPLASRRA